MTFKGLKVILHILWELRLCFIALSINVCIKLAQILSTYKDIMRRKVKTEQKQCKEGHRLRHTHFSNSVTGMKVPRLLKMCFEGSSMLYSVCMHICTFDALDKAQLG